MDADKAAFVDLVLRNPIVDAVLDRAEALDLPDWWLAAGSLFQTVWNVLDGALDVTVAPK